MHLRMCKRAKVSDFISKMSLDCVLELRTFVVMGFRAGYKI